MSDMLTPRHATLVGSKEPQTTSSHHRGLRSTIITTFMTVNLIMLLWRRVVGNCCPIAISESQCPKFYADITKFSPKFTPTVAHQPILTFFSILPPSNHR